MRDSVYTSLFELLLNIGTSSDLKKSSDSAILSYIQQLDCIGAVLYEYNKVSKAVLYKPKVLAKNIKIKEFFDDFIQKYEENKEEYFKSNMPYYQKIDDKIFYIFELEKFGFLLLIKKSIPIEDYVLKELRPINKKFSNSLLECKTKDIIAQKDELIYQQSKLASMGGLIQNITHQWKQPLSLISISASGTKLSLKLDENINANAIVKSMDEILLKVKYLSDTMNDFRTYFDINRRKTDFFLDEMISKVENFLYQRLKLQEINLIINKKEKININAYENDFIHIVMNIVNNAIDQFEKTKIEKKFIKIDIKKEKSNAIISIKDNAGGISKDNIQNIFEAYFTTKKKGSGIGLYMAKQLINKNLKGECTAKNIKQTIDNKEYNCALFEITLPLKT